jgi:FkbM family methyltransferase
MRLPNLRVYRDHIVRLSVGMKESAAWHMPVFIWRHPATQRRRLRAYARILAWQIWERTFGRPITIRFGSMLLRCYPHSTAASGVMYCGLPEWREMRFLLDFLRAGDTFVDIGANVGVYTLLAASVPDVDVVAFEPSTVAFSRLQENVALNRLSGRVRAERKALGAQFYSGKITTGGDTVNCIIDDQTAESTESVEVVTVDSELNPELVPFVALMKVDVEGKELDVLQGATNVLREAHPVLIVERNDPIRVSAFLSEYGYDPYTYNPEERVLCEADVDDSTLQNLLFVHGCHAVEDRLSAPDASDKVSLQSPRRSDRSEYRRLRVLIDATHLEAEGAGLARLEREVLPGISERHECVLLMRASAIRDGVGEDWPARRVRVPDGTPAVVVEQLVVPLIAVLIRPDVVHCFSGHLPLVPTPGRRVLSYLEDRRYYYSIHRPKNLYSRLSARVQTAIASRSLQHADHIVAISSFAGDQAEAALAACGRNRPPVSIAPLGVSRSFTSEGEARPSRHSAPYVVTLSSGDERDDLPWVMEAVARATGSLALVVVGRLRPAAARRAMETAESLRVPVILSGYVSDAALAETYRGAIAYLHGSQYEGFGLGAVEAMACGTPVIARPSAAVVEVIGPAGFIAAEPADASRLLTRLQADAQFRAVSTERSLRLAREFTWTRTTDILLQAFAS